MVTGAYHPEISSGGLQARLMAATLRDKVIVRVLTTGLDPDAPPHAIVDEVEVTRIHLRDISTASKVAAFAGMMRAAWRLVRWCDVVHLHGVSAKNILVTFAAHLLGKPIVLSLHTMGADEPAVVQHAGASWWAFHQPARYMSVSDGLTQRYREAGLPGDRLEQVGNAIDMNVFAPASAHEKRRLRMLHGIDPERPVVLFVGLFSHDKQPRVLFDAWLKLGIETSLVCVGATKSSYYEVDESLADSMRTDADTHGIGDRLTFTGVVHDVHEHFRLADVFMLPSRREGLPVALMEAMACGLPCVASRLPGATDTLIEDSVSGLLVQPGDVDAFANAIRTMLTETARADSMGTAARAFIADRFGAPTIAARWLANYRLALGRSEVDRT